MLNNIHSGPIFFIIVCVWVYEVILSTHEYANTADRPKTGPPPWVSVTCGGKGKERTRMGAMTVPFHLLVSLENLGKKLDQMAVPLLNEHLARWFTVLGL